MNLPASIHGAMAEPLRRDPFSEAKVVEFEGHMRGSAIVLRGDVHGLRDKSTDGVWSYDVENERFFGTIATSVRGAFRQKRNDINGQSAIARTFMRNPRP